MTDLTPFAGLIRHHVGEALSEEFLYRNPTIIDRLLQIGASTHHHDGHAALADPVDAPTATVTALGGTIPADTPIYLAYTLLDAQGGETAPSAVLPVSTAPGLPAPDTAPDAAVDNAAGTLLADTYYYAVTVVDGSGGETVLGPAAEVVVDPGSATNEIVLSGLDTIVTDVGGTEWRVWRAVGAGNWVLLNQGSGATMTDDGSFCPDGSLSPPQTATTNSTSRLTVQVPGPAPAGAVSFNLYLSTDGSFTDPALVATHPVADLGTDIAVNSLTTVAGSPPPVSLTVGGASKIDPDTEVLGVFKRPVANLGALPATGNTNGDIRETLNDHTLHVWTGAAWAAMGGGGGGGGASLSNPMDTDVEWTDVTGTPRARVYGHMRESVVQAPVPADVYDGTTGADEDPANGQAGYRRDTNATLGFVVVEPSTSASRATLDTQGVWSTRPVAKWGRAQRDIRFPVNLNINRIGVGFGDVTTHEGIFAWVLAGATWKLQIVFNGGGGYGSANEDDYGVIAEVDIATPSVGDALTLWFDLKPGNVVSATVEFAKTTLGAIPDTQLDPGLVGRFGDDGTVTKNLVTSDRWQSDDSWASGLFWMFDRTYHPEIWADVLPPDSGGTWTQRLLAGDGPLAFQGEALTLQPEWGTSGTDYFYMMRDDPNTGVVKLQGKVIRISGTAVGPNEQIAQIKAAPDSHGRPIYNVTQVVAIGDDVGTGIGILRIDGTGGGYITIEPIYALDPGQNPWVSLDGVEFRVS